MRMDYITLMASLPPLQAPERARQLPISPLRLEQRLRMLSDADAALVSELRRYLGWNAALRDDDAHAAALDVLLGSAKLPPTLHDAVAAQRRLRGVLAALRRRRFASLGGGRARAMQDVGGPRRAGHEIEVAALQHALPWAASLAAQFEAADGSTIERYLLRLQWSWYAESASGHEFDLEAVALYALRFDLLQQALAADAAGARRRFERLVADAVGSVLTAPAGATT